MSENETGHRCGPTQAQITDALLRGDVIGSYRMCDACSARSLEMAKLGFALVESGLRSAATPEQGEEPTNG